MTDNIVQIRPLAADEYTGIPTSPASIDLRNTEIAEPDWPTAAAPQNRSEVAKSDFTEPSIAVPNFRAVKTACHDAFKPWFQLSDRSTEALHKGIVGVSHQYEQVHQHEAAFWQYLRQEKITVAKQAKNRLALGLLKLSVGDAPIRNPVKTLGRWSTLLAAIHFKAPADPLEFIQNFGGVEAVVTSFRHQSDDEQAEAVAKKIASRPEGKRETLSVKQGKLNDFFENAQEIRGDIFPELASNWDYAIAYLSRDPHHGTIRAVVVSKELTPFARIVERLLQGGSGGR